MSHLPHNNTTYLKASGVKSCQMIDNEELVPAFKKMSKSMTTLSVQIEKLSPAILSLMGLDEWCKEQEEAAVLAVTEDMVYALMEQGMLPYAYARELLESAAIDALWNGDTDAEEDN